VDGFASPLAPLIYLFPPSALVASKAYPEIVCPTTPQGVGAERGTKVEDSSRGEVKMD